MSIEPDATRCGWCQTELRSVRQSFCSIECRAEWTSAGKGPSLKQVVARLTHADGQPRGHTTIDSFLAAGGSIYRE